MLAKFIARGFDENRESGLVREWSFARLGRIDRSVREVSSPLDARLHACHPRPVNGYPD
jgi:hypothetical protein